MFNLKIIKEEFYTLFFRRENEENSTEENNIETFEAQTLEMKF